MTNDRVATALRIVADAGSVARRVQKRLDIVRRVTKDDRSPVTVADFAVQAIVSIALRRDEPGVLIVGEEGAELLRQPRQARVLEQVVDAVRIVHPAVPPSAVIEAIEHGGHDATGSSFWTLDPVDGTKGFLRGQQYAIALAWIEDGRVAHGVMGCPNLPADPRASLDEADPRGMLFAASHGGGAWSYRGSDVNASPAPLRVAAPQSNGLIRVCESVEAEHSKHSDTAAIMAELKARTDAVRLDSQCKYAVVARGQADAYLRLPTRKGYIEKIWDHAAGSIIATEAGAIVSDITGAALDFSRGRLLEANRGIVCTTPPLHASIIETIERLGIGSSSG